MSIYMQHVVPTTNFLDYNFESSESFYNKFFIKPEIKNKTLYTDVEKELLNLWMWRLTPLSCFVLNERTPYDYKYKESEGHIELTNSESILSLQHKINLIFEDSETITKKDTKVARFVKKSDQIKWFQIPEIPCDDFSSLNDTILLLATNKGIKNLRRYYWHFEINNHHSKLGRFISHDFENDIIREFKEYVVYRAKQINYAKYDDTGNQSTIRMENRCCELPVIKFKKPFIF